MTVQIMMTVNDFAKYTGLSQRTVRTFCHTESFPVIQSGRKFMIHKDEAIKWLAEESRKLKGGLNNVR